MPSTPDKRSITMEDVAARAGVSRALVSIVFRGLPGASDENRARVMRAAEELSYRPDQRARLLGRSRSMTLGITFGLHHEHHGELVEALYEAAEGSGYELILSPVAPTRPEDGAVQSLLDYRCESLILIAPSSPRRQLDELADRVPVVLIGRAVRSKKVDVVRTDDTVGGRIAVEHLLELGHRHIAHIYGGRIAGAAERRSGYRDAMRDAGLGARVQLVPGGRTEDDGWAAADRLLADGAAATAVFAYNDQCAAGLVGRLRDRGLRVPDDLSVVGYDDTRLARSASLSLTTVAQDSATLARHALDLATGRAGTPHDDATEIVVAPRLVARRTTARPTELGARRT